MITLELKKEDIVRVKKAIAEISPDKSDGAIQKGMMKASSIILENLVMNVSGTILHRRTGNLARSLGFRVEQDRGNWQGVIGSGAIIPNPPVVSGRQSVNKTSRVIYANILETGGVIKPVNKKWLTIPLKPALTPAGVTKLPSARDYPNTFAVFRNGKGTIFQRRGKNVVALFLLRKSVTIPAFKYMETTAEQSHSQVVNALVDKIREAIK